MEKIYIQNQNLIIFSDQLKASDFNIDIADNIIFVTANNKQLTSIEENRINKIYLVHNNKTTTLFDKKSLNKKEVSSKKSFTYYVKSCLKLATLPFLMYLLLIPLIQDFYEYINNPIVSNEIKPTQNMKYFFEMFPTSSNIYAKEPEQTQSNKDKEFPFFRVTTKAQLQKTSSQSSFKPKPPLDNYCKNLTQKFQHNNNVAILIIPKIGVCTTVRAGNSKKILSQGAWLDTNFGNITGSGKNSKATVIAAHRFGFYWWSANYKKRNSFAYLPQLKPGDKVYIYYHQMYFVYSLYKTSTNTGEIDPDANLVLYTCIEFFSKNRYFAYFKQNYITI